RPVPSPPAEELLALQDRLSVGVAVRDVAASLIGDRLERRVGAEAESDVARAGVGLDPPEAGDASRLQLDVPRAGVGDELLEVGVERADAPRTGIAAELPRLRPADDHAAGAGVARQVLAAEPADPAVAACGGAAERSPALARLHLARSPVA